MVLIEGLIVVIIMNIRNYYYWYSSNHNKLYVCRIYVSRTGSGIDSGPLHIKKDQKSNFGISG